MREHATDKGKLIFHHTKKENFKGRIMTKDYYQCEKCKQIMQVITMPSYEEYVLRGQIWVEYEELTRIRKNDEYRRKKQEERKNDKNVL